MKIYSRSKNLFLLICTIFMLTVLFILTPFKENIPKDSAFNSMAAAGISALESTSKSSQAAPKISKSAFIINKNVSKISKSAPESNKSEPIISKTESESSKPEPIISKSSFKSNESELIVSQSASKKNIIQYNAVNVTIPFGDAYSWGPINIFKGYVKDLYIKNSTGIGSVSHDIGTSKEGTYIYAVNVLNGELIGDVEIPGRLDAVEICESYAFIWIKDGINIYDLDNNFEFVQTITNKSEIKNEWISNFGDFLFVEDRQAPDYLIDKKTLKKVDLNQAGLNISQDDEIYTLLYPDCLIGAPAAFTGAKSGNPVVYSLKEGKILGYIPSGYVSKIFAWDPQKKLIFCKDADKIKIYDITKDKFIAELKFTKSEVSSIAADANKNPQHYFGVGDRLHVMREFSISEKGFYFFNGKDGAYTISSLGEIKNKLQKSDIVGEFKGNVFYKNGDDLGAIDNNFSTLWLNKKPDKPYHSSGPYFTKNSVLWLCDSSGAKGHGDGIYQWSFEMGSYVNYTEFTGYEIKILSSEPLILAMRSRDGGVNADWRLICYDPLKLPFNFIPEIEISYSPENIYSGITEVNFTCTLKNFPDEFQPSPLAIGDSYGGGIVAYIFAEGDPGYVPGQQYGLIAATEDQSAGILWRGVVKPTGATALALGTGFANTNKINAIITAQGDNAANYAAGLARAYKGGGFTDWFLPSLNELNVLWSNLANTPEKKTAYGFANYRYWSSTEFQDSTRVSPFYCDFRWGSNGLGIDGWNLYVRAVRYFAFPEYSYEWNFGDGEKGSGKGVIHSYKKSGDYNVSVSVKTGDSADSSTKSIQVIVDEIPDIKLTVAPQYYVENEGLVYRLECKSGNAGKIGYVEWDFGDGKQGNGASVLHTYKYGVYSAKATVHNSDKTLSWQQQITVWPLAVGDRWEGGIIAYLLKPWDTGYSDSVRHGLIAAAEDQSAGIQWYNGSEIVTGATAKGYGSGFANTNAIIAAQGPTATNYAAGLARAYRGGGYDDWFLPSHDELKLLYAQRMDIGGFDPWYFSQYWSSSEDSAGSAWFHQFDHYYIYLTGNWESDSWFYLNNYNILFSHSKAALYRVRAVRYF